MEDYEVYNTEEKKVKKGHFKLIVGLIFILIIFSLVLFASSSPKFPIHGFTVKEEDSKKIEVIINIGKTIEMEIDENIEFVDITTDISGAIFHVGQEKLELKKTDKISLSGFDGKIVFRKDRTIKIDGESEKVFINGIPLSRISGKNLIISSNSFPYDNFELSGLSIKSYSGELSGSVNLSGDKTNIFLNEDMVKFSNFFGELSGDKNNIILSGQLKSLEIDSDDGKIAFS